MTAHIHTEYPETERPGVPFVGYADPHEQTGSDAEVLPLLAEQYVPVCQRHEKWRLWRDEHGWWQALQPSWLDQPQFSGRKYGEASRSGARALSELQLAIVKYEAAL